MPCGDYTLCHGKKQGGLSRLNIKKLEVFHKTVECASLSKAAKALGLTQSGVSHIIADLEAELGFVLLIRSRAGTYLTTEGERLLPYVRGILDYNDKLENEAASIRGLDRGSVRIATFSSVAVHWLPGIIKEFQRDYPKIDFKLMSGDYYDVDRSLTDGSADLGFITLPTELNCRCTPLFEDRLLAVVPADHRLAELEVLPIEELREEPFISLLEGSDQDARRALVSAGIKPNVKFTTKDDYAIIAMVEQGLGISIMPELLLSGRTAKVRVMELEPPSSRTIALAIPEAELSSPATLRFADYVRQWVREKYPRE